MTSLGLSASQKAQLAPIVRKAVAAERDYEQAVADLTPELLEAYGGLRIQAKRNMGFTDDVTERASDCSRLMKELERPLKEELKELEKQVRTALTAKQLALVENCQPRRSKHLGPGGTENRGRRPSLAGRRREAGQSGRGGPREEWTTVTNLMLCPAALPLLAPQTQSLGTLPLDQPEAQAAMAKIRNLETDLKILNLVNALNLTVDQMQQLVALAERVGAGRGRGRDTASYETLTAQREALLQARQDLLARGEISQATYRRLRSAAGGPAPGREGWGRMGKTAAGMTRLIGEAEKLLTNAQRLIVSEHKPYLVCPETVRDPARAGQVKEKTSPLAEFLDHMRRHRPRQVESRVERFVKGEEAKTGPRTPAERQARIDEVMAMVRKVSAMSDVDFALAKDQLVEEGEPSRSLSRARTRGPDWTQRMIGRCLLNVQTVPLLKERLDGNQ